MKPKVGRNFTSERGEGVKGEVKNISLHWLQGIFERYCPLRKAHQFKTLAVHDKFNPGADLGILLRGGVFWAGILQGGGG